MTYCCIKSYRENKKVEAAKLDAFREKNRIEAEMRERGFDPNAP